MLSFSVGKQVLLKGLGTMVQNGEVTLMTHREFLLHQLSAGVSKQLHLVDGFDL